MYVKVNVKQKTRQVNEDKKKNCIVKFFYGRVLKSSDSFFSKILEKASIVQKKMIPHINGLGFSLI